MSKRSTILAAFTLAAAARFSAIAASPLDLAALLREAEVNNPEIAALRLRQEAARLVPGIAEVPPDPVVSVSYLNDTVTGFTLGRSEFSNLAFGWTQEIPFPGKLRLGGEVASREVEMVRSRLEAARLGVAAAIKGAYADLYRIDRSASILGERRSLLVSLMQTARARYETGEGLLENVLRAQSEITRLDLEVERLGQERLSAGAVLNTMAGRIEDRPLAEATELPVPAGEMDPRALEAEALARAPEIHEREAAVLRDEARLDLARKQLKPDLIWGAAYQNRGGIPPMVMGTFGLRLPIYRERKQVQAIAQVRSETDASKQEVLAARLNVAARVRDLAARASRAGTLSSLYREALIPQSLSALDSASAAYGVGRADFLTLLDDFSAVLAYEIDYETQRAARVAALAALEPLTGRELVAASRGEAAREGGPRE
ncbi:MAG: TolC family protein [Acidobacteria bacterium]|nr:TolC family protein [Acidobacteriota bacterium]